MKKIIIGKQNLTIEDIHAIAYQGAVVEISTSPEFVRRIEKGREFLELLLKEDGKVYGVTTGFGDSCTQDIPLDLQHELPSQLVNFHRCGMGSFLSHQDARAVMAARLASLSRGKSGITLGLLNQLAAFLNADIAPQIPSEGSVGASGDLTPMSYVAAALTGEGDVTVNGELMAAEVALKIKGLTPYALKTKESLAIMNGTTVMTALATTAFRRAEYLCELASRITAMISLAVKGNAFHFDEDLFAAKPFPGQMQIAGFIRSDLEHTHSPRNSERLQDRYSLRCAPHVIGVLADALPFFRQLIETELNSSNDNPLIDADRERVLHGGHFYGGHIAFVMDSLKNLVANVADLVDRQVATVVDPKFNNGLPANLVGAEPGVKSINHGFKAVQIAVSAWTAEALKQTMPASVFSRSTECHNQDKVSMGTIAARDALRVLQLTEQVLAAATLMSYQAIEIRLRANELPPEAVSPSIKNFHQEIAKEFEFLVSDRPLDKTLRRMTHGIQERRWQIYS